MRALICLLVLAVFVMAAILAFEAWSAFYVVPSLALAVCYLVACIVNVQPKTAIVIVNMFGGMRETRQGWQFLLRPFEWVGEINGTRAHNIQKRVLDVKLDVESKDEEVLSLDLSLNYNISDLLQFLSFSEADFKESVSEHVKSMASWQARACKDRDEIMDSVKVIAGDVQLGFNHPMLTKPFTIADYHGIEVDTVVISDPELPEELKKAEVEREIAEKRAEAQVNEAKGLGKAAKALQGRTPKGQQPAMSKEKAVELELIRSGKIKKENKEVDIGSNLTKVVDGVPKSFLGLLGSMFGPKGGKRKGKKKGGP